MQVKSRQILGRNCYDEITNPGEIYEFPEGKLFCIIHSFYAQWEGRQLELRRQSLSVYHSESLQLMAHLEKFRFGINDLDFHPEKQLLLIATGSYDGGYFFEGELLIYDLPNRQLTKLFKDNREFSSARFADDHIEFHVSPRTDEEDYLYEVYRIPLEVGPNQVLAHFESNQTVFPSNGESNPGFDPNKMPSLLRRLELKASEAGLQFEHKCMAWDLAFVDPENIAIGFSNGTVGMLNIPQNRLKTKKIAENGDCTQIFKSRHSDGFYVNVSWRGFDVKSRSTVYEVGRELDQSGIVAEGTFSLSQAKNGNFLARQIDYESEKRTDILFDSSFRQITDRRLGHYDLFNHYFRIDGADDFYALIGTPEDQHQNKRVVKICPESLEKLSAFSVEQQPEHFNNLNGALIGEVFVIEAKWYDPDININEHSVMGMDHQGDLLWIADLPAQASGITEIESFPGYAVLALSNGDTVILDSLTGETALEISANPEIRGYPLSLANHGNQLAIGHSNGLVELIELQ